MNSLINLPYCFLFVPLILSGFNILQSYKITNLIITISCLAFIMLLSFYLIPELLPNIVLEHKINNNALFIAGEYRINLKNIIFIIFIFFIKLLSFMFFDDRLIYAKKLNFFFAIYLINYFAICGILISNNIFNIFIYMELYAFCLYNLMSNYKNISYTKVAYNYYNNGVLGSLFFMLFVFIVYFTFGSADINFISNNLHLTENDLAYNLSIFVLVAALIFKFFSFNFYFLGISKSSNITNMLFINILFADMIIGIYILWKFLYNLFNFNIIFGFLHLDYLLYFVGSAVVIYNSYRLYTRTNLLSNIYSFSLIILGYILILLGINNSYSFVSIMSFILNHLTIDFLFYIVIALCLFLYKKTDIPVLYAFYKYKFIIFAIILSKLMFPISFGFSSNWNYVLSVLESNKYYLLVPFIIEKFFVCVTFIRYYYIFCKEPREDYRYLDLQDRISLNTNYVITILVVFSIIVGLSIFEGRISEILFMFRSTGAN